MAEAILFNYSIRAHQAEFSKAFDDNSFLRYLDATNDIWHGVNNNFSIDYISISGSITAYAFAYRMCPNIINMEWVGNIGIGAFYSCFGLISIVHPNSQIQASAFIDAYAFYMCKTLSDVNMYANYIGPKAFESCISLCYINSLISNCYAIEEDAFKNCHSLRTTISNTNNEIYIGGHAFEGCINISECNLAKCYYIGKGAFSGCTNLSQLLLGSQYDKPSSYASLYIMDYAFYGTSISSLNISYPFAQSKISYIGDYAFANCQNLTYAVIDCYNIGSGIFAGDQKLSSIIMNYLECIPDNAFPGLQSLEGIYIPHAITIGSNAFGGCTNLKKVYLYDCEYIESNSFGGCYAIQEIVMSKLKEIPNSAFPYLPSVTDLDVFNECTSIGSMNFNNMVSFNRYINLNKILYINRACFNECINIQGLNVTGSQICNYIGEYCFNSCPNLQTVTIMCKHIDSNSFNDCSSLTTINIINQNGYYCSLGSSCFNNCININNLTLFCSFIGNNVFTGTKPINLVLHLNSETFPSTFSESGLRFERLNYLYLRALSYIPSAYFKNYSTIDTLNIAEIDTIYEEAFANCTNISLITLGIGKTSDIIDLISSNAFTLQSASIYIASSLYSLYIAHSVWSYFSSMFVV